MPPLQTQPVRWVTQAEIRRIFNEGRYAERAQAGELRMEIKRNGLPPALPPGEPPGTRSQIVKYFTLDGEWVATVHQYMRPDGSIGASGLPDPKALVIDQYVLKIRQAPPSDDQGGTSLNDCQT